MEVKVEISARHVHLDKNDFAQLFGNNAEMKSIHTLSVAGEFQSDKRVTLVGPKRSIPNVSVIGPLRAHSQIEVSRSDTYTLGEKNVPLRIGGDLAGTSPIKLVSEHGEITLKQGMIVMKRHLHISAKDAEKMGLANSTSVGLEIGGERGGILHNVVVRISDIDTPVVHLDTDEGNAFGDIGTGRIRT